MSRCKDTYLMYVSSYNFLHEDILYLYITTVYFLLWSLTEGHLLTTMLQFVIIYQNFPTPLYDCITWLEYNAVRDCRAS